MTRADKKNTKHVVDLLNELLVKMEHCGYVMADSKFFYGDKQEEMKEHGLEMLGASSIVKQWLRCINEVEQ